MKATIQFETGKPHYGRGKSIWTINKEFNGQRHMDNFINYITKSKGYFLDEVFIQEGFPFSEGDDYWTIEGNDVVWSCWDAESEKLYSKNTMYFTRKKDADDYLNKP